MREIIKITKVFYQKYLKFFVISGIVSIFLLFTIFYWTINFGYQWLPKWAIEVTREREIFKHSSSKNCKECHGPIFNMWTKGRHSIAWTSETFIEASENRSKEKCLPCHVPKTIQSKTKPLPRLNNRDEGISCFACHVKKGVMYGPYDLFSPPHPTQQDDNYVKSDFCASCHVKTFKEWEEVPEQKKTCQFCHMPRSSGRLTQKFPLHFLHASREIANHSIPTTIATEKDLDLKINWKDSRFKIILENKGIPHGLPTADNGDPRLYIYVNAVNSAGRILETFKEIFAPQQESALQFKQPRQFDFYLPHSTKKAMVLIKMKSPWKEEKNELIRREFKNPKDL